MEVPDLERRLAAIVAADVEGYSSLMHSDEGATMATLSARRPVTDALIIEHRGRIANTAGDSVLAAYLEQHSNGHFAALARTRLLRPASDQADAPPGEAVELAFWESVHDTEDPRLLAAYLEKYPNGEFAVIAHARLEVLRNEKHRGGSNGAEIGLGWETK
jgi:hypothetical protein